MSAEIYTIGHSNHIWETFAELLKKNEIELLVDVRANPVSRFAPFANRTTLPTLLERIGIDYEFMGGMLGGRPSYNSKGRLDFYNQMWELDEFQEAVSELVSKASRRQTVVLCCEEDPSNCHRQLLLARPLRENECELRHIRADGRVQSTEQTGGSKKKYGQQFQGSFRI